MKTRSVNPRNTPGVSRLDLLHAGLAAGAALAAWPLYDPQALWSGEMGTPKPGGTLRRRGWDPVHFDPHLTINNYTNSLLSFTHSRLVRHTVGADVQPGTFIVEPDVAERWEALDDTTYVFHLRQGGK
jgi:ABC-type transport system substrate-binding protein